MAFSYLDHYISLLQNEQSFFERFPTILYFIDKKGKFVAIQGRLQEVLGYQEDELLGQFFREYVSEESKTVLKDHFAKVQKGEIIETTGLLVNMQHKYGHTIILELNSIAVQDDQWNFLFLYGVATDQTERERIRTQLEQEKEILFQTNKDLLASYQAIGKINAQLSSLLEVNTTFSSAMPWKEKVDYIFTSIAQFTRSDFAQLRLYDPESQNYETFLDYSLSENHKQEFMESLDEHYEELHDAYAQATNEKYVVKLEDIAKHQEYPAHALAKKFALEGLAICPIIISGASYGVMIFFFYNQEQLEELNQKLLLMYASQVALALLLSGELDLAMAKS